MATEYLTVDGAVEVLGAAALRVAAPDPEAADGIDRERVGRAIADVAERVDARLRTSYAVPLAEPPAWLGRDVARLVHAELAEDSGPMTDLIADRAAAAEKRIDQVARGAYRLSGADTDADGEANARTMQGAAVVTHSPRRLWRRGSSAGIV